MAKLHGFVAPLEFITEFDGSDEEDVVDTKRKPAYVRQLAMVDEPDMPDNPLGKKAKEDWPDSYDITVTVSTTSRLYEKYKWNEERIQRLKGLIARFVKMSVDNTDENVAGMYSLNGDQLDMFDSLQEAFPGACFQHEDALVRKFQHLPQPKNLEN